MIQNTEPIRLVKNPPSDDLATKVLVRWYEISSPRWKKPLDWSVAAFFVLMTICSFFLKELPWFAWMGLICALLVIVLSWFYVPFLAKAALESNKKSHLYHEDKHYTFYKDHLRFSSKSVKPIDVFYEKFTTLWQTPEALMFLFGKKLVLWLPTESLSNEQTNSILRRFREHGVEIRTCK